MVLKLLRHVLQMQMDEAADPDCQNKHNKKNIIIHSQQLKKTIVNKLWTLNRTNFKHCLPNNYWTIAEAFILNDTHFKKFNWHIVGTKHSFYVLKSLKQIFTKKCNANNYSQCITFYKVKKIQLINIALKFNCCFWRCDAWFSTIRNLCLKYIYLNYLLIVKYKMTMRKGHVSSWTTERTAEALPSHQIWSTSQKKKKLKSLGGKRLKKKTINDRFFWKKI